MRRRLAQGESVGVFKIAHSTLRNRCREVFRPSRRGSSRLTRANDQRCEMANRRAARSRFSTARERPASGPLAKNAGGLHLGAFERAITAVFAQRAQIRLFVADVYVREYRPRPRPHRPPTTDGFVGARGWICAMSRFRVPD